MYCFFQIIRNLPNCQHAANNDRGVRLQHRKNSTTPAANFVPIQNVISGGIGIWGWSKYSDECHTPVQSTTRSSAQSSSQFWFHAGAGRLRLRGKLLLPNYIISVLSCTFCLIYNFIMAVIWQKYIVLVNSSNSVFTILFYSQMVWNEHINQSIYKKIPLNCWFQTCLFYH